jgi:hypothetical protein
VYPRIPYACPTGRRVPLPSAYYGITCQNSQEPGPPDSYQLVTSDALVVEDGCQTELAANLGPPELAYTNHHS